MTTASPASSPVSSSDRPTVALVGAGHAHLHVAARAAEFAKAGLDLVLIDPGRFWYSSLATGMLGGRVSPERDSLDPAPLVETRGGRFLRERVMGIDPAGRRLTFKGGGALGFDLLSLNLGSTVSRDLVKGDGTHVWGAKPIPRLLDLRRAIEAMWAADPAARPRLLVVGAGVGGTELALNLAGLADLNGREAEIAVLGETAEGRAGRRLSALLTEKGIAHDASAKVVRLEDGEALLEDGRRLPFDHAVLATGLVPHPLVAETGLPADRQGLRVTPTLNSLDAPHVFAAGDCASLIDAPRPKVGVFGVHAAPILTDNLLASGRALIEGRAPTLTPYRPQKRWLWVLDCGDGTGLGAWGGTIGTAPGARVLPGLLWRGRSALRLKHGIDRRFMARYRVENAAPAPDET